MAPPLCWQNQPPLTIITSHHCLALPSAKYDHHQHLLPRVVPDSCSVSVRCQQVTTETVFFSVSASNNQQQHVLLDDTRHQWVRYHGKQSTSCGVSSSVCSVDSPTACKDGSRCCLTCSARPATSSADSGFYFSRLSSSVGCEEHEQKQIFDIGEISIGSLNYMLWRVNDSRSNLELIKD